MLRSGFGLALKRCAPAAYARLFGGEADSEGRDGLFVPYLLEPPSGGRFVAPGETFEFELRLFGDAVTLYPACLDALTLLGRMGLGRERGRYALLAAAMVRPGMPLQWEPPDRIAGAASAADWFVAPAGAIDSIALELLTPLRLKDEGRLVGHAPEFEVLWSRLYARVSLAAGQALLAPSERAELHRHACTVRLAEHDVRWHDWTRYSARQQQTMKFGGLLGRLRYVGLLAPFFPWLSLGTALGLGGKTTFGLG